MPGRFLFGLEREEKMAIRAFAISVQPANPAAAYVHPRGLQMPLAAAEMFAATSPSLFMCDWSCVISQVPFPCQNS